MSKALVIRPASSPTTLTAPFDPAGLGPIPGVPLVPEQTLRRHHVFVPNDHRFRAAARLLQSLWREDRGLPMGSFIDSEGKRKRLGSSISGIAGRDGANFLSPAVGQVANRELIYREIGALYDVERLRQNLLSSMPLAFNTFALLKRDLTLATRVMAELLPGFMREVTHVLFEHSPGRANPAFTGDHTALDVAIRGTTPNGRRAFIGIEVKYSESLTEQLPRTFSSRYAELAVSSALFADVELSGLWRSPVQQHFRQHSLVQTILDRGLADVGLYVTTGPALNHLAHQAADAYASYLAPPRTGHAQFLTWSLERVIEAIAAAGLKPYARLLYRRYCDFWLVDGELALDDAPDPFVDTTGTGPAATTDTAPAGT